MAYTKLRFGSLLALLISGTSLAYGNSSGVSAPRSQIAGYLHRFEKVGQLNGVALVARGDQVLYRGAFGMANLQFKAPNAVSTKFLVASMTKTLTATMVMRLVEEGKLSLTAPASAYLPDYAGTWLDKVTLDQLLTHTAGVQGDISDFPTSGNNFDPIVAMINSDFYSLDEQVRLIAKRPLLAKPGEKFSYSSDGYAILGDIVAHTLHKPYEGALKTILFDPLKMSSSGYAPQTAVVPGLAYGYAATFGGYENGRLIGVSPAGGAYTTADDLFKWIRAIVNRKALQQSTLDRIWRRSSYITAYGWKVRVDAGAPKGATFVQCSGAQPGYNALATLTRSDDLCVILLTNTREVKFHLSEITDGVLALLRGKTPAGPKQSIALELAEAFRQSSLDVPIASEAAWNHRTSSKYYVDEAEMNDLGYYLIAKHKLRSALAVLTWNTRQFPKSGNAFDSLGEICLDLGDKRGALTNYQKSLRLDPKNDNAARMIEKLGHK